MPVLRMNRSSEGFYEIMGPVFGSRAIERDTHDRFYDDADKEWYCIPGEGAASVKHGSIRNFWASSPAVAAELLAAMQADCVRLSGIVPCAHREAFSQAGFSVRAHRVNFLEVRWP